MKKTYTFTLRDNRNSPSYYCNEIRLCRGALHAYFIFPWDAETIEIVISDEPMPQAFKFSALGYSIVIHRDSGNCSELLYQTAALEFQKLVRTVPGNLYVKLRYEE